ncbi:MAG: hypothetical protein BGO13_13770 [Burkholderiales bacterium 66-5]|nr:MAG: hypothetical protein BGO13_13770 [Burkholderiales bacterium 66-5]
MRPTLFLPLIAALLLATAASAQTGTAHQGHGAQPANANANAAADSLSEGEVRKIDSAQGKITLRHGPIAHLEMPGMTMVFRVSDPALLDGLKAGDKVRFRAEQINGALTVTEIAPAH